MEKTAGQVGYEAYGWGGGTKTIDGQPRPTWEQLDETEEGRRERRRWEMTARALDESDAFPDYELLGRPDEGR